MVIGVFSQMVGIPSQGVGVKEVCARELFGGQVRELGNAVGGFVGVYPRSVLLLGSSEVVHEVLVALHIFFRAGIVLAMRLLKLSKQLRVGQGGGGQESNGQREEEHLLHC